MTGAEDRDAAFATLRPHLERVAYATLGSRAEAEDVVQDAWLRLQGTAPWRGPRPARLGDHGRGPPGPRHAGLGPPPA